MSKETLQPLQGMSDIAAPEVYLWQRIESAARRVLSAYYFSEVRTPVLERTSVFTRSIGDTSDIVQKEMYAFEDRGGRQVALRPEGTAPVMRYVAAGGQDTQDARLYYLGPMFRCERPQAGRKRQFHQLGVEAIGAPCPATDVEVIALQLHLLKEWGLDGCRLLLNTRGQPEEREQVAQGLRESLRPHLGDLCEDCVNRFEANVLRVLDCKKESCQAVVDRVPPATAFMSTESSAYFSEVKRLLDRLEIPYEEAPRLVRGLDYYAHTVWEITHSALGAQDALAGGGRYRMELGGRTVEGTGFAMGLERVLAALQESVGEAAAVAPDLWLVSMGEEAFDENLVLMQGLRLRGVCCAMDLSMRSMKAQMRAANRSGASRVVIRGEQEIEAGIFILKDMENGTQEELEMPELLERLLTVHEIKEI